ncbi:MAG: class IV adenylate cyclase [Candidatus Hodarchaeota archaeon]
MIEVEIKVGISNPNKLRKKIEQHDGFYKLSLYHEDTYFNLPNGLRNFKETDEALRVRKSIEFNINNEKLPKRFKAFITYKGKKIDSLTKTRKEIEVKINNFDKMIEILKILGFQEVLTIRKQRELYEIKYKNQKLDALIDFIPDLDRYFLEVEFLKENSETIDNNHEILFEFLNMIGIEKNESIRESYLELILNKVKKG